MLMPMLMLIPMLMLMLMLLLLRTASCGGGCYSSIAPTRTLNGSMDDMVWNTCGSMAKASGPSVSTKGKL